MYSLVMLAALTASTNAPNCHYRGGCHGCYGCGGCYGCYGCGGCYGCYGCGGCYGCYGCGGCYGCYGCGGCWGCYGGTVIAPATTVPAAKPAEPAPKPKPVDGETSLNTGRLVVELPTDAKLFIDDHLMKASDATRTFKTPKLERGQAYYYVVRAELVIDGKTYQDSKRVIVRAGETAQANFMELANAKAKTAVASVGK